VTPFYEHISLEREKQRMRGWAAKAETSIACKHFWALITPPIGILSVHRLANR